MNIKERSIVHVDMDAFYAAVEQRDNPALRGKPVIVGADPKGGSGRGVVATCSYEARKFGIHSAMPISIAYQKCPDAVFLLPDMEKYSEASRRVFEILYNFTPDIEPLGIDEAFLDITTTHHLFPDTSGHRSASKCGTPLQTCRLIKERIKEETGLNASIGLAPTKMAAKIASDLRKPDGLVEVTPGKLLDFLRPLDVGRIWGLGKKGKAALNDAGIKTIGQLAKMDVRQLAKLFGNNATHLHQLANGIDNRPVEPEREAKSVVGSWRDDLLPTIVGCNSLRSNSRTISNEITFDSDTADNAQILSALSALSEKVAGRLRNYSLKCRTITLKIRLQGFETYTRAVTIAGPVSLFEVIYKAVRELYQGFDRMNKKVRLVGVKASNLSGADTQPGLFGSKPDAKREALNKAVDKIKSKFGDSAIYRATSRINRRS